MQATTFSLWGSLPCTNFFFFAFSFGSVSFFEAATKRTDAEQIFCCCSLLTLFVQPPEAWSYKSSSHERTVKVIGDKTHHGTEIINTFHPKRMQNFSGLIHFHSWLFLSVGPTIQNGYLSTSNRVRFAEGSHFFVWFRLGVELRSPVPVEAHSFTVTIEFKSRTWNHEGKLNCVNFGWKCIESFDQNSTVESFEWHRITYCFHQFWWLLCKVNKLAYRNS